MKLSIKTAPYSLVEFRQRNGVTLEKLSEKTGVAKSTLIAIEAGKVKPQAITIYKLNKYLSLFN